MNLELRLLLVWVYMLKIQAKTTVRLQAFNHKEAYNVIRNYKEEALFSETLLRAMSKNMSKMFMCVMF